MILLIDAGNTRVKWRVIAADAPHAALAEGAVGHAEIDMLATACRAWPKLARACGARPRAPMVPGVISP